MTTVGNIVLDGQFTDWAASELIMQAANTVAGYQVFGKLVTDATLGTNYVIGISATAGTDPAIAVENTIIYLNTDQNTTTGFSPWSANTVGAEYYVKFTSTSGAAGTFQPFLYSVSSTGVETLLNGGAALNFAVSIDGKSLELAVPQTLLTPAGGTTPHGVDFAALIANGAAALPAVFGQGPEYTIPDTGIVVTKPVVGGITLDGQFTDWNSVDNIANAGNTVAGYQVFGKLVADAALGNTYVIGINATSTSDPGIAVANTYFYLNTDQNNATGFSPFGATNTVGAEYYVKFVAPTGQYQPYLYSVTAAGVETLLNGGAPLKFGVSTDGRSLEVAVPQSLVTAAGGTAPHSINFDALIANGAAALPTNFAQGPEYTITDPSTIVAGAHALKKVGIVYSATSAALFFGGGAAGQTAYSDLFMAAQHQAEAAGVSYDILTEADLTNVSKLAGYAALVFPDMQNVQSSQAAAITASLIQVVNNYHIPIITAGDFLTNDQTGAALPGNPYAAMQALLDLHPTAFGTATYTVTPDAANASNPVMAGYTAGQLIGGASGQFAGTTAGVYTNVGYGTYAGIAHSATVLADINIQGGSSVAGVVSTTTGGTNYHFATTGLLGDSNLLQHAIQSAAFGTTASLALHNSRFAGIVASRTDMDQSQFTSDVSPTTGQGIYDKLIPILQQWKAQYNFVGTYYVNIGDQPALGETTNWAKSAAYYKSIIALGSEIGNHSYTHLINPPTGTAAENTNLLGTGTGPFTFDYEFNQSKLIEQAQLGITIAGAAVPGAPETLTTAEQIAKFYQSVAGGLTGYVSGGWTGVGSGFPNAFGYLTPSDTGSVYIAPNITFDFTEVEFQHKTIAQALADWESLFNQMSANSANPVIVWPWHDYGAAAFDSSGAGSPYSTQLFTDFIAYAAGKNYEFVTDEMLAARISAQQKATVTETTAGNVVTATVTADPSAPDLGGMALDVVNGGTQVIQNAGSWYAYDTNSVFLPKNGGTFTVTLGATQDDVTHIDALPMRADLLSVTGNGSNLAFSMTGDGVVDIHVKTPGTQVVSIQGAQTASLTGTDLVLTFNDGALAISSTQPTGVAVQHNVTITESAVAVGTSGNDIIFGGSGNDRINGGAGNDFIVGGAGNDRLTGGAGSDTFLFKAGFGQDVITDFTATTTSHDTIQLDHTLFAGIAANTDATLAFLTTFAKQVGTTTVITVDAADTITLNNTLLTTLKANLADIHFV